MLALPARSAHGRRRGKFVVIGVVLAFDAVWIAILIAHYGSGVWFPSD